MVHKGLACGLDAILLCIITHACVIMQSKMAIEHMLNSNRSGSISCLELSGLSHGLLQLVLQSVSNSLQVSVAMPYYSTVMVSIGVMTPIETITVL